MEITEEQNARIKDSLPVQRGNVRLTNPQVLNAVLYVAEQGCKWRGLPKRFGRWHTIYMRVNRSFAPRRSPAVDSSCWMVWAAKESEKEK